MHFGFLVEAVSDLSCMYLWEQLESFEYINQAKVVETWYIRRWSEAIAWKVMRKSQALAIRSKVKLKSWTFMSYKSHYVLVATKYIVILNVLTTE